MAKSKTATEEPVVAPVEVAVVEKKKKKKSKEAAEEEAAPEKRERETTEATEEPAKKKKKKSKTEEAVEETAAEATAEPTAEKTKKKKKSDKSAEEKAVEEEVAAETEPPKKKKKKAVAEEEAEKEEEKDESTKSEESKEETPAKEETAAADEEEKPLEKFEVIMFGLPFAAEEETVKAHFAECGEIVSFRMPMNNETGQTKGMAFMEFSTKKAMDTALEYNESAFMDRTLRVRVCEPDNKGGKGGKDGKGKGKGKDGKGKGKGKGKGPSEKPEDCKSIVIKGMSYSTDEASLRGLFEECGTIANCKILTDRETGESKGMAFIDFEDTAATDEAVKKSNAELDGRWIFVDYSGGAKGGDKGKGKDGKGKGKDGKGKGKGKGKKGGMDKAKAANMGSLQEGAGKAMKFDDSDDE